MKKEVFSLTALLVVFALLAAVLLIYHFAVSTPLIDVKPTDLGYLGDSRVFLVSANVESSFFNGQRCFIVNVTVRNDYQPGNFTNDGRVYVFLQAQLNSRSGPLVSTNIGPTYLFLSNGSKGLILSMGSNETDSGPIYISAKPYPLILRRIYSFKVELVFVGPLPPP